jgi:hypothetical protein
VAELVTADESTHGEDIEQKGNRAKDGTLRSMQIKGRGHVKGAREKP